MALRRPPTRIELKTEDIEEYEQLENERLLAEADAKKMTEEPSKDIRRTPPRAVRKIKQVQRIGLPG